MRIESPPEQPTSAKPNRGTKGEELEEAKPRKPPLEDPPAEGDEPQRPETD